ncbi:MAG TPA: N-acetyl-alpha-D-glucosaminyl L-malate synthase BshA [Trueperaceae bacterium]
MNIGVLLHSGAGGSGVVATELGIALARHGHQVHFVADRLPFRLVDTDCPGVYFHEVETLSYPLFSAPLTTLSEASKLVEVIEETGIDLVHAHYAVPHATAALLGRDMARHQPKPALVTTLHGTDVTLVGLQPAYLRTTQFSVEGSDVVTAVSSYLAGATREQLGIAREIRVIPNPVDTQRFRPREDPEMRRRYAADDEKLLMHVSNFRPVKRVQNVLRVFAQVAGRMPARLLMIGDGPDRPVALQLARDLSVADRVTFLGSFPRVEKLLALADLFLLPSSRESFGLAALEAMSSGVPVVGSASGGLPEVVEDGRSGCLRAEEDVAGMAECALRILADPVVHRSFREAARARAVDEFAEELIVPQYLAAYEQALAARRR